MRRLALALATLLAALAGCTPRTNPDKGRYACLTATDCGAGFECIAQFAGGALCFKAGACGAAETCNGVDDNCDGRVDEVFPGKNDGCETGKVGACAVGTRACKDGAVVCAQTNQPSAELCNGLDDDCNGQVDETFSLSTDPKNCGRCASACDAGTTCAASTCRENSCGDSVDNDLNGLTDCADPSCLGQLCDPTAPAAWNCGVLRSPAVDGGASDGGASDGGASDGGASDGGDPDAGLADAGPEDAGLSDAGADAGGLDGGSSDAGSADAGPVRACVPPESACDNGLDDDGDGQADCLDPDCDGRTCASGTLCAVRSCPGPG